MNRQERRREKISGKVPTYNITKPMLHGMIQTEYQKKIEEIRKDAYEKAINDAMVLLLTLPMEVLMNYYWTKSYQKRLPGFVEHVLDFYEAWQNGELDIDILIKDLEEYGGIKLNAYNG